MPRVPKQSRSKATVDAIVEAGFLAVAERSPSVSTRYIADIAGVSVGSLYEYFDNKDAIFKVMHQRFVDDVLALIAEVAPQMLVLPTEAGLRQLLNAFKSLLLQNDQRYLLAAKGLIHLRTADYVQPVRDILMNLVVQLMASRPEYARIKDVDTMAYILINSSIHLLIDHLSSEQPPISFDQLVDGLVLIISTFVPLEGTD